MPAQVHDNQLCKQSVMQAIAICKQSAMQAIAMQAISIAATAAYQRD